MSRFDIASIAGGISMVCALAACGAFESDDPPAGPAPGADAGVKDGQGFDAGPPPPVEGRPTGEMALSLPDGKLLLVRGTTHPVKIVLERKNGFTGAVTIGLANAPPGLTAKPLELASNVGTGDLELAVGKDVPQGELANALVEASNPTLKDKAAFPLSAFVRGAPGEIDTTYAAQGIITLAAGETGVPNPATGEVYVSGPALKRYRADGTLDTFTGAAAGRVLAGNFLYSCSASGTGGEPESIVSASRVSIVTGQRDDGYKPVSPIISGNISHRACLASAAGNVAFIGASYGASFPPYYGHLSWFSPAGTYTPGFTTGAADEFRTGVFVADGIVVGTTSGIAKIKTGATGFDTSFGSSGRVALSSGGPITTIVEDSDKKILVANATFTARVTASGSLDGTFVPATTSLNPTAGFGRLALQADGKILKAVQLGGGDGRACALTRYLPTGALDTTFGNQGSANYPVSPCSPELLAVAPDGKILVGSPKILRVWD